MSQLRFTDEDWLAEQVCDAVAEGQPRCVVLGKTMDWCLNTMRPKIISGLQKRNLALTLPRGYRLYVDGSTIIFTTPQLRESHLAGVHGYGIFSM